MEAYVDRVYCSELYYKYSGILFEFVIIIIVCTTAFEKVFMFLQYGKQEES